MIVPGVTFRRWFGHVWSGSQYGDPEAIAAAKYYFKAGNSRGDLFFGFQQRESHGLALPQPLSPAVEAI